MRLRLSPTAAAKTGCDIHTMIPDQEVEPNRRGVGRLRVLKKGLILFNEGRSSTACHILDISETGAKPPPMRSRRASPYGPLAASRASGGSRAPAKTTTRVGGHGPPAWRRPRPDPGRSQQQRRRRRRLVAAAAVAARHRGTAIAEAASLQGTADAIAPLPACPRIALART